MAKKTDVNSLDALLNDIKNSGTRYCICSAEPTTFAEATATFMLAQVTVAAGDMTLGAGTPTGSRRLTFAAKSAIPVTNPGTGNHVAVVDVANSRIKHVTIAPAQALAAGGTADVASWYLEQLQPT